jgi:hypothetical protein
VTTDVTPAITAILHVYMDYVKAARWHFMQVENHVTSRDSAKIAHFMSRYLSKDFGAMIINEFKYYVKYIVYRLQFGLTET